MKLQDFLGTNKTLGTPQIAVDKELATQIQIRLVALGLLAPPANGQFGPKSTATFKKFQALANCKEQAGILGADIAEKLIEFKSENLSSLSAISTFTVDVVAKMFFDAPRSNIKNHLPRVLNALDKEGLGDRDMILMALGTIRAETAGFVPISEGISKYNTSPGSHPFNLYDLRRSDLGNNAVGHGEKYKGRGFVQLTGRSNYETIGKAIGLGDRLVNEPELANDPDIAAQILARFLKNKEQKIRQALLVPDFEKARKLVNGGVHGLERFKVAFQIGDGLITAIA